MDSCEKWGEGVELPRRMHLCRMVWCDTKLGAANPPAWKRKLDGSREYDVSKTSSTPSHRIDAVVGDEMGVE